MLPVTHIYSLHGIFGAFKACTGRGCIPTGKTGGDSFNLGKMHSVFDSNGLIHRKQWPGGIRKSVVAGEAGGQGRQI
jgi:hypothetical protein